MLRTNFINNMFLITSFFEKLYFPKMDLIFCRLICKNYLTISITYLYPCSWLCKCITVLHKLGHANESATEGRRTILSLFCVKTTVHSELIRKKNVAIYARIFFFMYVYYYTSNERE